MTHSCCSPHGCWNTPTSPVLAGLAIKETAMTKLMQLVAAALFLAGLAACNTIEGAGEDVEELGEEIDEEV